MSLDYINEAFKKLDLLTEDVFDTSLTGINNLSTFMNDTSDDDIIRVVDDEATSEEELKDSYVGKVIVNCNICHSHIFKNKEDINVDPEGIVNGDEQCPYCGEQDGFTVVGEIAPYAPEAETTTDDAAEDVTEVEVDDTAVEPAPVEETDDTLEEDFKNVSITTDDQHLEMSSDDNGKVTVTTEPIEETALTNDEMIVPVSDETQTEIEANNEDAFASDIDAEVEMTSDIADDEEDIDFEDIDEESIDELGEGYLKRVYENVDSFKTTDVFSTADNRLIVEGTLKFNSGVEKKTGFIFEAKDVNAEGSLRFTGFNKHLTESKDAYTLVGSINKDKVLVLESLKYNYSVGDAPVRGIVRKSSK